MADSFSIASWLTACEYDSCVVICIIFSVVPLTYLEISVIAGRSKRLFKNAANSLLITLASGGKSEENDLEGDGCDLEV